MSAMELENKVAEELDRCGWRSRAAVVVLDPELEIWVWASSPLVPRVLGLAPEDLEALLREGYLDEPSSKPNRPKEAMEAALRRSSTPRSSSLYAQLARAVKLSQCKDPAFLHLKQILQSWFPRT